MFYVLPGVHGWGSYISTAGAAGKSYSYARFLTNLVTPQVNHVERAIVWFLAEARGQRGALIAGDDTSAVSSVCKFDRLFCSLLLGFSDVTPVRVACCMLSMV